MERKDMKLGFIGFGNMAQAIAEGLLRSKALEPEQICACAKDWDKLCAATQPRGMRPCRDAREVAEAADVVIVAVKPHLIEEVLSPVRGQLADKAVVSVAAGWPFERYEALLPGTRHLEHHAKHAGCACARACSCWRKSIPLRQRNTCWCRSCSAIWGWCSPWRAACWALQAH